MFSVADKVLKSYVGNAARSLEILSPKGMPILRGIIDHASEPKIFQYEIHLPKFGLAMLEEIIHDATNFINHKYRKDA